jgi:exosome complex component RRP45
MPREADPSNVERNFILEALSQNVRVDGRALNQIRNIELEFGDEYGSASLCMGRTRVFVQISASVTKPSDNRKFDGVFTISTELSSLASPAYEVGR